MRMKITSIELRGMAAASVCFEGKDGRTVYGTRLYLSVPLADVAFYELGQEMDIELPIITDATVPAKLELVKPAEITARCVLERAAAFVELP